MSNIIAHPIEATLLSAVAEAAIERYKEMYLGEQIKGTRNRLLETESPEARDTLGTHLKALEKAKQTAKKAADKKEEELRGLLIGYGVYPRAIGDKPTINFTRN